MSSFYSAGFNFHLDSIDEELDDILFEYGADEIKISEEVSLFCITLDDRLQLWFKTANGRRVPDSLKVYVNPDFEYDVIAPEWLNKDSNCGLARVWTEYFPMNIAVPDADLLPDFVQGDICKCRVTCFADHISVYSDADDFAENCEYGEGYSSHSFVPTGCYEKFGNDSIEQNERAFISGVVLSSELRENPFTRDRFWFFNAESDRKYFSFVAAENQVDIEPKPGCVFIGSFSLLGKIIK